MKFVRDMDGHQGNKVEIPARSRGGIFRALLFHDGRVQARSPDFFKIITGAEMGRTKFLRDKDLVLRRETKREAKRVKRQAKRRSLLNNGIDSGKGQNFHR